MSIHKFLIPLLCLLCLYGRPHGAYAQAPDGLSPAAPAAAAAATPPETPPPGLLTPVACTLGADCWIVNYVDTDPGDGAADYRCGPQTYDQHLGTDFALRDRAAMRAGVDVLAAAAGTVLRVRDGIEDRQPDEEDIARMLAGNRGCGNGVIIDNGDGWQTIYCHMQKDSIAVKPNEKVTPGQRLGLIGQSGAAEFPHLHFGLFRNSQPVDPFTGAAGGAGCHVAQKPLWLPGLRPAYQPVVMSGAGFAAATPTYDSVLDSAHNPDTLPVSSPALTFWGLVYNVLPGDRIALRIAGPDGQVFAARDMTADRRRAQQFYYVGKRTPGGLPPGTYTGILTLDRATADGTVVQQKIGRAIYIE